jgi:hypothetical protein
MTTRQQSGWWSHTASLRPCRTAFFPHEEGHQSADKSNGRMITHRCMIKTSGLSYKQCPIAELTWTAALLCSHLLHKPRPIANESDSEVLEASERSLEHASFRKRKSLTADRNECCRAGCNLAMQAQAASPRFSARWNSRRRNKQSQTGYLRQ